MAIEVECKGCHARYRVKEELAGRTVECKHCGQKFRVPYRSAVVRLGDEEQVTEPAPPKSKPKPAESKAKRDFVEYGVDPNDPTAPIGGKPRKERPRVGEGILPELVADLWLPLGLMIVTYGISLFIAINAMSRSNGPLAGMILLGIVVAMFFALVIPMTMRMIEGASKTLGFEAPNSIWLQTAGLIGLPTAGLVLGAFGVGSVAATIAFGLIGFVAMMPLMTLLLRVDVLKGVQAAVLAGMFYLLSLAVTGGVIAAVGLWLMPLWHITRPWDDKPAPEVATNSGAVAPAGETPKPDTSVNAVAVAPTTPVAPTSETVTPAKPTAPVDPWDVPLDAWAGPGRLPAELSHILNVRPPVRVLSTSPLDLYAAVVDQDGTKVFDLRNGKRLGLISERAQDQSPAAISKDGAFVAFEVKGQTGAVPPSIEVWSVDDGKMVLRIPANGPQRALGFDTSARLHLINTELGTRVVQGWDVRTRRQVSTLPLEGEGAFAVSPNARLLACVVPGKLHVYDLLEAKLVGRRAIEPAFGRVGQVAFSPDGSKLAAAVSGGGGETPVRLLLWNLKDGAFQPPVQVPATAAPGDVGRMNLVWLPDGAGLIVNDQMIDCGTNQTIHTAEYPQANGVTAQPRVALSNFRVLCEIAADGPNGRLIYRTLNLPRAEVLASLKKIRGADWEPAPEAEPAAPALASASASPELGPDAAAVTTAPAAPRVNPAMLKEWVVAVTVVTALDGPSIERQLKAEQTKLAPLESTYRAAESRADQISGEYISVPDGLGGTRKKKRYSTREISEARGAAKRAQEDMRDVKIKVAQLQRELDDVATTRTVTGTLADGTPVVIAVEGAPLVAQVDPLEPGNRIKITGAPRFLNGTLEVKLRTVTPAEWAPGRVSLEGSVARTRFSNFARLT